MSGAGPAAPPALLAAQFMVAAHRSELVPSAVRGFSQLGEQIVLANDGGTMRAFANICRHRGARIVADGVWGTMTEMICPYHGWRYGLDGQLIATRGCARPADDKLTPLASVELGGLVFVAIAAERQAAFEAAAAQLRPIFDAHGLGAARVCRRWSFRTATNWRLFVENFLECYHCHRAHPLLTRSEAFIDLLEQGRFGRLAETTRANVAAARDAGWPIPAIDCDPNAAVFFAAHASMLSTASETLDGTALPTRLGVQPGRDGLFVYGYLGPLTHFTILPDYALIFQFRPVDAGHTDVELIWLAASEQAFTPELLHNLTGFWQQTISEDAALTENVEINAGSRFMPPQRFTPQESEASNFNAWLVQQGPG